MRLLAFLAVFLCAAAAQAAMLTPDKLWLKADAGCLNGSSVACANNDAVATWTDQSPAACNVTQATSGNRPTYKANVFNGQPGILFNAANTNYLAGAASCINPGGSYTAFMVVQPTAENVCAFGIDSSDSGSDGAAFFCAAYALGNKPATFSRILTGPVLWQASSQPELNQLQLLIIVNDGTTISFYKGPLLAQSTAKPAGTFRTIAGNFTVGSALFGPGAFPHSAASPMNGYILEIGLSTDISGANRNSIVQDMQTKWGMPKNIYCNYHGMSMQPPGGSASSLDNIQPMMMVSCDGEKWTRIDSSIISPTGHTFRDPVYFYWPGADKWVALAGNGNGNTGIGSHTFDVYVEIGQVGDRGIPQRFDWQCSIDVSSVVGSTANSAVYEPRPIRKPDNSVYLDGSGLPHIRFVGSSNANASDFYYDINPTTLNPCGSWTSPIAVTWTSSEPVSKFDQDTTYDGTTFYLWYANLRGNSCASPETIEVASSTSEHSGYTIIKSGDWNGWNAAMGSCTVRENFIENVKMMRMIDGRTATYFWQSGTDGSSFTQNPNLQRAFVSFNTNTNGHNPTNGTWSAPIQLTFPNWAATSGYPESFEPHPVSLSPVLPLSGVGR